MEDKSSGMSVVVIHNPRPADGAGGKEGGGWGDISQLCIGGRLGQGASVAKNDFYRTLCVAEQKDFLVPVGIFFERITKQKFFLRGTTAT